MIIVIGVILISMGAAIYTYAQYKTNFIIAEAGEPAIVGPVEYAITFDGTHKGNNKATPENIFVKIRINAKNISNEETKISGSQFYLIDEKQQKYQSIYGGFSVEDLSELWLKPDKQAMFTTQFDAPYDEQKQFSVVIRPLKQQSSVDIASICIINC